MKELTPDQRAAISSHPKFIPELLNVLKKSSELGSLDPNSSDALDIIRCWTYSPAFCAAFLRNDGLNVIIKLLYVFSDNFCVDLCCVQILLDISRVEELYQQLLKRTVIWKLRMMLKHESTHLKVVAAAAFCHLMCGRKQSWNGLYLPYQEVLNELVSGVLLQYSCCSREYNVCTLTFNEIYQQCI